ncbi:rhodanese-like domain-containing protein [Haloferula sp.]|uniref:rhodanese-like domain-containing protein n=1 Tax=Haloferula sp. TaxID=2497595 RepID=UPI003C779258
MKTRSQMISTGMICVLLSACTRPPTPEPSAPVVESPAESAKPAPADSGKPKTKTAPIKELDISQLFALRAAGKTLIYDVRLPFYYKLGHIDGAILFYPKPFDEAFDREQANMKQALNDGKEIVLYCGSEDCNDSHVVAEMIAKRGIPVSVYSGGWMEWKAIGMD